MTAFESGATVGRYRIVRPLGEGAMGVVYLAQDPQIERLLAIKTVRPAESVVASGTRVAERHERLLREARTVGRLIHPNIVTLFDAGEQDGLLYLAFEYVEGPSLDQRLRSGEPVSTAEALRIARETAEGLAYAHARGVVHRDVKPANLLLAADGRVKISDFGIAKVVGQATELTLTGTVVGSPHYLSPEQVRGEELDGRSDLFSLGVVLYELLGGRRPFDGETLTTLVYQILHQEPPPIELRPELAPMLSETLGRLLAKDRDLRFDDGHAVAAALGRLERELPAELLAAPAVVLEDVAPTRLVSLSGGLPAPPATRPGEVPGEPAATRAPVGADLPPLPPPPPAPASPASGSDASALEPAAAPPPPAPAPGRSRRLLVALGAVLLLLAVTAGVAAVVGLKAWHRISAARVAEAPAGETPPATSAGEAAVPEAAAGTAAPSGVPPAPTAEATEEAAQAREPAARVTERVAQSQASAAEERPAAPSPQPPSERSTGASPPAAREPAPISAASRPEPLALRPAARENPQVRREVKEMLAKKRAGLPPVDQELDSGLALTFEVHPSDAFVLLDGTVIGRAEEHEPGRDPYLLPGAGTYLLKLRSPGMEDYRVLVRASASGPATSVVSARLEEAKASGLELGDLELHRVREAIAFHAYPPTAVVVVDGRPMGRAQRYPGRFARGGTWLHLAPGRHRVSVVAPGFHRRDFAVDVSAGASEARERIEVRLAPIG